jgi:hypothetical protein
VDGNYYFNKNLNFIELLTFIQFLTTHKLTLTPPKPHLLVTSNLQASIWKKYLELQNKVQTSQLKNFGLAESIIQKSIQREYKCKELRDFLHEEFPTINRDFHDQEMKLKKYFADAFNQAKTKN